MSGEIPREIRSLKSLESLRLHNNQLIDDDFENTRYPSAYSNPRLPCLPKTVTEFFIKPGMKHYYYCYYCYCCYYC